VVVSVALDLTWLLTPWTDAPVGPVDPTAGLPGEAVDRAERVAASLRLPALLSTAAGMLAAAAVVLTPPGRRLLGLVRRVPGGLPTQVVAQVLTVLLVVLVVRWPFGVWAETVRRAEGLSVQSWGRFARDRIVGAGLEAGVLVLAVLVVVVLARLLPRWWPAVVAAAGAVVVVVLSSVYPLLVEPALADLRPLEDGPVRTQVEQLAAEAGAPVSDVLVSDTSTRSTTLNAYVSGPGPHPPDGPAGHAAAGDDAGPGAGGRRPRDRPRRRGGRAARHAMGAAGTAAAALVLGCAAMALLRRRGGGPGAVGSGGAAGAVLLVVLLAQQAAVPAESLLSRQVERAADARALELTGDPEAFAQAFQVLLLTNLADPSPPGWVQWWFGSHPTGAERVAVARETARR
jgi:STE24 endopeptidase